MASAETLLSLPLGTAAGALWDPLLSAGLRYRHDPVLKQYPWIRLQWPEPLSHAQAAMHVIRRTKRPCRYEWLKAWEETVPNWRRPDGPVAWPYLRVSDKRKADSGNSFEIQITRIIAMYHNLFPQEEVVLGPAFSDPATSAWHVRLRDRRGGRAMHQALEDGDHILFYQPDRSARVMADAAVLLHDIWQPRNIEPHFCSLPDLPFDTSHGELIYNVMGSLAQWYSQALSERQLDLIQLLRSQGRACHMPRTGWKVEKQGGLKLLVPDLERRKLMAWIEHLRDIEELTWSQIEERTGRKKGRAWNDYRSWKDILASGTQQRPAEYERARVQKGLAD